MLLFFATSPAHCISAPQPVSAMELVSRSCSPTQSHGRRIAEARERLAALSEQAQQPYEYAERLEALFARPEEIASALDLTKNQKCARLDASSDNDTRCQNDRKGRLDELKPRDNHS
jgi:hypothetical protein